MQNDQNELSAVECKLKGNDCVKKKDYDTAVKWYTEAIDKDPTQHVFYSNRSAAHLKNGNPEAALLDGIACIKTNPGWIKGYNRKGCALHALKRYEEAVATFKTGLKIEPGHVLLEGPLEQSQCCVDYAYYPTQVRQKDADDPMENIRRFNAFVDSRGNKWSTPLLNAAEFGNNDVVRSLVRQNIHTMNNFVENARYIQSNGLDGYRGSGLNVKDPIGDSCIMWSIKGGSKNIDTIILLHQLGADIDARNDYNWTALMRAAAVGNFEIVQTLVNLGANIHLRQVNGKNAVGIAAEFGCIKSVKLLAKKGADINVRGMNKFTPIMRACSMRNVAMIRLLGALGAELNHKLHNADARDNHTTSVSFQYISIIFLFYCVWLVSDTIRFLHLFFLYCIARSRSKK